MVTIGQVQQGLARYVDEELISKMEGWQRWVFGAGAAMYLDKAPQLIEQYRQHPAVKMLGVIGDDNHIDIDKLYQHMLPQAKKGAATITIPMLGAVTLDERDIEKLYRYIINS